MRVTRPLLCAFWLSFEDEGSFIIFRIHHCFVATRWVHRWLDRVSTACGRVVVILGELKRHNASWRLPQMFHVASIVRRSVLSIIYVCSFFHAGSKSWVGIIVIKVFQLVDLLMRHRMDPLELNHLARPAHWLEDGWLFTLFALCFSTWLVVRQMCSGFCIFWHHIRQFLNRSIKEITFLKWFNLFLKK